MPDDRMTGRPDLPRSPAWSGRMRGWADCPPSPLDSPAGAAEAPHDASGPGISARALWRGRLWAFQHLADSGRHGQEAAEAEAGGRAAIRNWHYTSPSRSARLPASPEPGPGASSFSGSDAAGSEERAPPRRRDLREGRGPLRRADGEEGPGRRRFLSGRRGRPMAPSGPPATQREQMRTCAQAHDAPGTRRTAPAAVGRVGGGAAEATPKVGQQAFGVCPVPLFP